MSQYEEVKREYWNELGHRSNCDKWGDEEDIRRCTCPEPAPGGFIDYLLDRIERKEQRIIGLEKLLEKYRKE